MGVERIQAAGRAPPFPAALFFQGGDDVFALEADFDHLVAQFAAAVAVEDQQAGQWADEGHGVEVDVGAVRDGGK